MLIFIVRFSGNFNPGTAWMPNSSPRLKKSCMTWRRYLITAATVLVLGVGLLAVLALLNRHNQVVGFNQEIQYDDFAFSVLNLRKANTLNRSVSGEDGESAFYVVRMKIANHARRVNYTFKKSVVILVDDRGNEYHLSAAGQKAFESEPTYTGGCESDIPPGSSCLSDVVFQLPAAGKISHLRISEGGRLGDVADTIFYGNKVIKVSSDE